MYVLSFTVVLSQVTHKFNLLTVTITTIKADSNKAKEKSLTRTIQDTKRKSHAIQEELRLDSFGNGGGTASMFGVFGPSHGRHPLRQQINITRLLR